MIRRLFSVLMWGTATAAGGLGLTYVLSSGAPPADVEILSWFGLSPWIGFGVIIWLIFFVVFFLISFASEGGGGKGGG